MLGACKWCVDRSNIECKLFALSMEPGCRLRSARFCINSKCFFIAKTYGLNQMISQIRGHTVIPRSSLGCLLFWYIVPGCLSNPSPKTGTSGGIWRREHLCRYMQNSTQKPKSYAPDSCGQSFIIDETSPTAECLPCPRGTGTKHCAVKKGFCHGNVSHGISLSLCL